MKQLVKLIIILFSTAAFAQEKYISHNGELIFSFADYSVLNNSINTPLRFSMFFHSGRLYHQDFNENIGIYTGVGIRNVGFTSTQNNHTIKRRNYYVGVPLAIKIGNLKNRTYAYFGVEGEIGFNYKEKNFEGKNKVDVFDEWFSKRTPLFMPSVLFGFNNKRGVNLRFKYYLLDFLDENYTERGFKIYKDINASKIFYFSLSYNVEKRKGKRSHRTKATTPISL